MTEISQNFISGFDTESGRFTLTSLGTCDQPNVEEFESVEAIDYKITELEAQGYDVVIAPCIRPELYRYVY